MSPIDSSGKRSRQRSPVAGSIEAGLLEPKGLPSELTQTTKNRSVSSALPGPTMRSHQPSDGSSGEEAAWAEGERPVNSSTALSRRAFSRPQVS